MKLLELSDAKIERSRAGLSPLKYYRGNPCRGFDTETDSNGDIFLLVSDSKSIVRPTTLEALNFLYTEGYDSVNWFFNIRFDWDAIAKEAVKSLSPAEQKEYRMKNRFKVGPFTVRFIEKKFFSIAKGHGKTVFFWDVWQFLTQAKTTTGRHDLDSLAEKYLGEAKVELPFSKDRIYEFYRSSVEMRDLITTYAIKDADLTRRLAEFLLATIKKIMPPPERFYSKAYLSEFYVRTIVRDDRIFRPFCERRTYRKKNGEVREGWGWKYPFSATLMRYAYRSFKGGIFDISVKGRVRGTQVDLNSAYPYQIAHLPDLTLGTWTKVKGNTPSPNALLGFYRVRHRFDGWFPFREKTGFVSYPETVGLYEDYISREEYDYLREKGKDFVVVISGFEWTPCESWDNLPNSVKYPFLDLIGTLFDMKKRFKNQDESLYWLVKIILNGIYGKFAQARKSVGRLFNPVYASLITGGTRLSIARFASKHFRQVYEVATDSIYGEVRDMKELKAELSPELGQFDIQKEDWETVVFQSGSRLGLDGKWIKSRGFNPTLNVDLDATEIVLTDSQPLHLRSAILQKKVKDTNRFSERTRIMHIRDNKRNWEGLSPQTTLRDLFKTAIKGGRLTDDDMKYL